MFSEHSENVQKKEKVSTFSIAADLLVVVISTHTPVIIFRVTASNFPPRMSTYLYQHQPFIFNSNY